MAFVDVSLKRDSLVIPLKDSLDALPCIDYVPIEAMPINGCEAARESGLSSLYSLFEDGDESMASLAMLFSSSYTPLATPRTSILESLYGGYSLPAHALDDESLFSYDLTPAGVEAAPVQQSQQQQQHTQHQIQQQRQHLTQVQALTQPQPQPQHQTQQQQQQHMQQELMQEQQTQHFAEEQAQQMHLQTHMLFLSQQQAPQPIIYANEYQRTACALSNDYILPLSMPTSDVLHYNGEGVHAIQPAQSGHSNSAGGTIDLQSSPVSTVPLQQYSSRQCSGSAPSVKGQLPHPYSCGSAIGREHYLLGGSLPTAPSYLSAVVGATNGLPASGIGVHASMAFAASNALDGQNTVADQLVTLSGLAAPAAPYGLDVSANGDALMVGSSQLAVSCQQLPTDLTSAISASTALMEAKNKFDKQTRKKYARLRSAMDVFKAEAGAQPLDPQAQRRVELETLTKALQSAAAVLRQQGLDPAALLAGCVKGSGSTAAPRDNFGPSQKDAEPPQGPVFSMPRQRTGQQQDGAAALPQLPTCDPFTGLGSLPLAGDLPDKDFLMSILNGCEMHVHDRPRSLAQRMAADTAQLKRYRADSSSLFSMLDDGSCYEQLHSWLGAGPMPSDLSIFNSAACGQSSPSFSEPQQLPLTPFPLLAREPTAGMEHYSGASGSRDGMQFVMPDQSPFSCAAHRQGSDAPLPSNGMHTTDELLSGLDVSNGASDRDDSGSDGGGNHILRSHKGCDQRKISAKSLKKVYHLPINEAADQLGIGVTVLKKYCRIFEIPRWPYRKLKSMDKLISSVEDFARQDPSTSTGVLEELKGFKALIYADPCVDIEERIKRLRQANFKMEYKQRQTTPRKKGGVPKQVAE